jgi:aminopeptidase-like protein
MKEEIFFSTYLCHPSMANNELSGPAVAAELIKKISKIKNRNYTYRFIFAPETIGALAYIKSRKIKNFKNVIHAFNLTCLANGNEWSIMPTRTGNTYTDYFAKLFLRNYKGKFILHDFLARGSDERQYNSPKVDIPMVSIMRNKYHDYDSYHTNLDNLENLDLSLLYESIETYSELVDVLEEDCRIFTNNVGEPFLNKFKDTESLGGQNHNKFSFRKSVLDFLAYSDGRTFIQILDKLNISIKEGNIVKNFLQKNDLISTYPVKRNLDV